MTNSGQHIIERDFLFFYADPCAMKLTCLGCTHKWMVFGELSNNGSQCCYKDFDSIVDPVTFVTASPVDCPPDHLSNDAITFGI